jgi:hypothetical protein
MLRSEGVAPLCTARGMTYPAVVSEGKPDSRFRGLCRFSPNTSHSRCLRGVVQVTQSAPVSDASDSKRR